MKDKKRTYFSKKELITEQESCIDFAISEAKETGKFRMPESYLDTFLELAVGRKTYHNLEYNEKEERFYLRLQNGVWINPERFIVSKKHKDKHDKYFANFGTKEALSGNQTDFETFEDAIAYDLKQLKKHNKRTVEKLANSYGITNKNFIKELTEYAIVKTARQYAQESNDYYTNYQKIVELYKNQVNLSHRTSQSMLMQQYSTPAPVSYIASLYITGKDVSLGSVKRGGRFTKNHFRPQPKYIHKEEIKQSNNEKHYFEPSAGNGLLTIALPMQNTIVNEIDDIRLQNLRKQDFEFVTNQDATNPFTEYYKKFDGVITNPPFGTLMNAVNYDGYKIKTLDHLMALRTLDTMKDDGKAAIVIGGHTNWDDKGRIQAGKNRLFFNYLYSHYHVEDVISLDGNSIFRKQGTSFSTRLILIDGRKQQVEGFAPLKNKQLETVETDFEDLWQRVFNKTTFLISDKAKQKRIRITNVNAKLKLLKLTKI